MSTNSCICVQDFTDCRDHSVGKTILVFHHLNILQGEENTGNNFAFKREYD